MSSYSLSRNGYSPRVKHGMRLDSEGLRPHWVSVWSLCVYCVVRAQASAIMQWLYRIFFFCLFSSDHTLCSLLRSPFYAAPPLCEFAFKEKGRKADPCVSEQSTSHSFRTDEGESTFASRDSP